MVIDIPTMQSLHNVTVPGRANLLVTHHSLGPPHGIRTGQKQITVGPPHVIKQITMFIRENVECLDSSFTTTTTIKDISSVLTSGVKYCLSASSRPLCLYIQCTDRQTVSTVRHLVCVISILSSNFIVNLTCFDLRRFKRPDQSLRTRPAPFVVSGSCYRVEYVNLGVWKQVMAMPRCGRPHTAIAHRHIIVEPAADK
ncbi:hypothetical protein J6590_070386 [Homalodisca vitripennis]|nr:hypothetical protein J6590_070386 [Homalodisca vitripennis]